MFAVSINVKIQTTNVVIVQTNTNIKTLTHAFEQANMDVKTLFDSLDSVIVQIPSKSNTSVNPRTEDNIKTIVIPGEREE